MFSVAAPVLMILLALGVLGLWHVMRNRCGWVWTDRLAILMVVLGTGQLGIVRIISYREPGTLLIQSAACPNNGVKAFCDSIGFKGEVVSYVDENNLRGQGSGEESNDSWGHIGIDDFVREAVISGASNSFPSIECLGGEGAAVFPERVWYSARAGQSIGVRAALVCRERVEVFLEIDGRIVSSETVLPDPLPQKVVLPFQCKEVGRYQGQLRVACSAGSLAEFPIVVEVFDAVKVWVLCPDEKVRAALKALYSSSGMAVRTLDAGDFNTLYSNGLKPDAIVVQGFDCFGLGSIADALFQLVSKEGVGLVLYSGPGFFDFYSSSEIQVRKLLPVRPAVLKPAGKYGTLLGVIVDSSGSMGDRFLNVNKVAASVESVVDSLKSFDRSKDRIFAVAFSGESELVIPPMSVANREMIVSTLRRIVPSGTTFLSKALRRALKVLLNETASIRHLLVLTDGIIGNDLPECLAVVRELRAADVVVSAYGIGDSCDSEVLEALARTGGGRAFYGGGPAVSSFYYRSIGSRKRSAFRHQSVMASLGNGSLMSGNLDLRECPPLLGFNSFEPKENAEWLVRTVKERLPLFVRANVGSGKVVFGAVPCFGDSSDLWVSQWPLFSYFHQSLLNLSIRQMAREFAVESVRRTLRGGVMGFIRMKPLCDYEMGSPRLLRKAGAGYTGYTFRWGQSRRGVAFPPPALVNTGDVMALPCRNYEIRCRIERNDDSEGMDDGVGETVVVRSRDGALSTLVVRRGLSQGDDGPRLKAVVSSLYQPILLGAAILLAFGFFLTRVRENGRAID